MSDISCEELAELCKLTIELTRLRQNDCTHLCIENFAPEVLRNLIEVYIRAKSPVVNLEPTEMMVNQL